MADTSAIYQSMLTQIERLPSDEAIKIKAKNHSFHWDVMAEDIKNLLMEFLFVGPSLRNELNSASEKVKTLQEQMVCDPESEMDTVYGEPPKWEYRSIPFNKRMNYIAKFDQLGGEGWELTHLDYAESYAIFKRRM